jgi:hypothetical protein
MTRPAPPPTVQRVDDSQEGTLTLEASAQR